MANEVYVYPGDEAYRIDRVTATKEITRKSTEAAEKIRLLYDAGTPFYTKEAIRDVWQQLEKASIEGQKVWVRGLDGVIVDFDIECGRTIQGPQHDLEFIIGSPFIHYLSIQQLMSSTDNFVPRMVYCNLRIYHHLDIRKKFTQELVSTTHTHSLEEVEEFFKAMRQAWETSEPCKQLRSTFLSISITLEISKIVALACGPLAYNHQERWSQRPAFQHALILTLRDVLSMKVNHDRIECYAQDPAYTKVDRSVLEGSGIRILDDPQAFLEVDDSTVVISCAADLPVKQIISDLARPAMLIWEKLGMDGLGVVGTDPDSSRLGEMIHNFYDELRFPDDVEHFGHLAIYIRRTTMSSSK